MISCATVLGTVVSPEFSPEIRRGLDQLARASDYAQDLETSSWDLAVEIERLLALGMTTSDLRWLVKRGYLSHARETTAPQDTDRRFEPAEHNLAFGKNTCFVLTEAGLSILGRGHAVASREIMEAPLELPSRKMAAQRGQQAAVPNWDRDTRTFLVGESMIKRFRVPSPNQEAVLEAFQEEGWPASIDDPLSPVPDYDPKRRLRDTIKCLNLHQSARLIRFRGDGTGQRVLWELVSESVARSDATDGQFLHRAA